MFARAKEKVARIAESVRKGVRGVCEDSMPPVGWFGSVMNPRAVQEFRKADLRFKAEPACTDCGICAKVCPVENIAMKEGIPS